MDVSSITDGVCKDLNLSAITLRMVSEDAGNHWPLLIYFQHCDPASSLCPKEGVATTGDDPDVYFL